MTRANQIDSQIICFGQASHHHKIPTPRKKATVSPSQKTCIATSNVSTTTGVGHRAIPCQRRYPIKRWTSRIFARARQLDFKDDVNDHRRGRSADFERHKPGARGRSPAQRSGQTGSDAPSATGACSVNCSVVAISTVSLTSFLSRSRSPRCCFAAASALSEAMRAASWPSLTERFSPSRPENRELSIHHRQRAAEKEQIPGVRRLDISPQRCRRRGQARSRAR